MQEKITSFTKKTVYCVDATYDKNVYPHNFLLLTATRTYIVVSVITARVPLSEGTKFFRLTGTFGEGEGIS